MKFVLEIEVDNAAMRYGVDLADALNKVGNHMSNFGELRVWYSSDETFPVLDANGNTVGEYRLVD